MKVESTLQTGVGCTGVAPRKSDARESKARGRGNRFCMGSRNTGRLEVTQ